MENMTTNKKSWVNVLIQIFYPHLILAALLAKYFTEIQSVEIITKIFLILGSIFAAAFTIIIIAGMVVIILYLYDKKSKIKLTNNDQGQGFLAKPQYFMMIVSHIENLAMIYFAYELGWWVIFAQGISIMALTIITHCLRGRLRRKIAKDMLANNFRAETQ